MSQKLKLEMITLDGDRMKFESITQAELLGIPRPTIYRSIKSGDPISRGKFKGCSFKLLSIQEPIKIKTKKTVDNKTHLHKRFKALEDISQLSREKQAELKRASAFQGHQF